MKLKRFLLALIIPAILLPTTGMAADQNDKPMTSTQNSEQASLTVRVSGIRNDDGVIRIALFNSAQSFADKTDGAPYAFRRAPLPIKNGEAVWEIKDLPYGVYAIKLFHDEDNSGVVKKNFVGKPKEGIGFSNNPKVTTKAPSFDEAKFTVNQPQNSISIQMINP